MFADLDSTFYHPFYFEVRNPDPEYNHIFELERDRDIDRYELDLFYDEDSLFRYRRRHRPRSLFRTRPEHIGKEIESENNNFIKEKEMKYELYPLYINWKKIEEQNFENEGNYFFNVFKLFGFFGEAIFEILIESNPKNDYYTHKNFLKELFKLYKKEYKKEEIDKNIFYKKLMDIFENVVSLVKNKIIIFKEITIFLLIFKIYQAIFSSLKDKKNYIESLKNQFIILSYLTNDEYLKIYNTYLDKYTHGAFQRDKSEFIKQIKKSYKIFS